MERGHRNGLGWRGGNGGNPPGGWKKEDMVRDNRVANIIWKESWIKSSIRKKCFIFSFNL